MEDVTVQAEDYTIVVCFASEAKERFIMARHRERGWELPGGTVKPAENPLIGGVREFGEETGHLLRKAKVALKHVTGRGTCWIIQGLWGDPVEGHEGDPGGVIEEVRFVESLHDVHPLAWPDDPYDQIESAVGAKLR